MASLTSQLAPGSPVSVISCHTYPAINLSSRYPNSGPHACAAGVPQPPLFIFQEYAILSVLTLFALQTSSVFYSTSMCSDKFGDLEMVSSQNGEEREKEKSPLPHPEPLTVFQQSGGQSPDSRLVSEMPPGWGLPSCLLPAP